jgi:hypothetical protein
MCKCVPFESLAVGQGFKSSLDSHKGVGNGLTDNCLSVVVEQSDLVLNLEST